MSETSAMQKTILILKSQAGTLGTVELFLRNRGWELYSTANLKEALIQIVTQKPSYVLISVDHANKKVRALPKLLNSAFPAAIMVFAETQSSASYKALDESATEYRIYPPVTGPAIERCVNKYLKDQQTKNSIQQAEGIKLENSSSSGNETISIKGGANSILSVKGTSGERDGGDLSRLLSQFLGEEAGNLAASATTVKADSNLIFAEALDENPPVSDANFIPALARTEAQDPHLSNSLQTKGEQGQLQRGAKGIGRVSVQKGFAGIIGTYIPPEVESQNSNLLQKNGAKGAHVNNQQGTEGEDPGTSAVQRRRQSAAQWVPMPEEEYHRRRKKGRDLSDANETLIARGVKKSLEESVQGGMVTDKIEETTSAACIIVDSTKFSGYLITAMGKNRKIDQTFIETVYEKLFKFLKDNGEELTKSDSLNVKIKQVDFEPWAVVYADFLRKSVHQGNEVAMAFFPRRPIKAILEDSAHHAMAKIHLDEFHSDCQVEFDIYVYLPTNNKYILYTPKGGVFYNNQMEHLKKQGVTHMHVQRNAALAVEKYKAQNYLNDMIDHHEKNEAAISKVKAAS